MPGIVKFKWCTITKQVRSTLVLTFCKVLKPCADLGVRWHQNTVEVVPHAKYGDWCLHKALEARARLKVASPVRPLASAPQARHS
eukprot:3467000-Rhodomonas_salina.6